MKKVYINANALSGMQTGIGRVTFEITKRLVKYDGYYVFNTSSLLPNAFPPEIPEERRVRVEAGVSFPGLGFLARKQVIPKRIIAGDYLLSFSSLFPMWVRNTLIMIHDMSVFDTPAFFKRYFVVYNKILMRISARRATKVFTVSNFSKMRIAALLGVKEESIVVVPCAPASHFYRRDEEEIAAVKLKYMLPEKYILFVGSLEPRKNLSRLLRAWNEVSQDIKNSYALCVVGGRGEVFRDDGVSQHDYPKTRFLGYVGDSDLPALYSGAHFFVYPSLYEGFGIPPLEAMACGTPAIVSNCTSLPEVCGDAALYCDPLSVDSIKRTIQVALQDGDARRSCLARIPEQLGKFSWENSARIIDSTIKQIML